LGLAAAVLACGSGDGEPAEGEAGEATEPSGVAADLEGTAPEVYRARFETSAGDFVVEVHREWAPHGADRFYNLVRHGHYDGVRFFRVVEGFMAQFGISGDPDVAAQIRSRTIPDDPVLEGNTRGRLSFAMAGPGTRTSQVFINFVDNTNLDGMGFAAFGEVVEGMDVVDALHAGYGDGPPGGSSGPRQDRIQAEGNAYLNADFAELDYVERATIIEP
jgi:peptidyl-prolyl cis-trans isomerase A (cyclophilin A)